MTISFIGAAINPAGNTVTLPSHTAGDRIIGYGVASGGSITPPGNWNTLATWKQDDPGNAHGHLAWIDATSASESFGTWTGSEFLYCAVYRTDQEWAPLTFSRWSATLSTQVCPNLANPGNDTNWFVRMGGWAGSPVTDWTLRASQSVLRVYDTGGPVSTDAAGVGAMPNAAYPITIGLSDVKGNEGGFFPFM